MNHVVLFDPSGKIPEGEIVDARRLEVARAMRVETLPLDLDMLRATALGGYAKRSYGSGWRFDARRPGRGCPLVVYATQRMPTLVWTIRLVPAEGDGEVAEPRSGQLRVAVDTGQLGAMAATLRPETDSLNLSALGDPDEDGGWYCRGRGTMTMQGDSLVGLMIYGMASGVRVSWWAASQVPTEQLT